MKNRNKKPFGLSAGIILVLVIILFFAGGKTGNNTGSSSSLTGSTAGQETVVSSESGQEPASAGLTFRTEKLLAEHYQKHGVSMGFSNEAAYLAAANAVVANPDAQHKKEAEDGDDVYFLASTGDFVIVSTDGYIRTYYKTDQNYFDRQ